MSILMRQILLFAAGCLFAALILPLLSDGLGATAAKGLVLWLAFYPFATTASRRPDAYWGLLLVGLPVGVLAKSTPAFYQVVVQRLTLAIFAAAIIGVLVQRVVRSRGR